MDAPVSKSMAVNGALPCRKSWGKGDILRSFLLVFIARITVLNRAA
jgi:hypothetical protein